MKDNPTPENTTTDGKSEHNLTVGILQEGAAMTRSCGKLEHRG